jgi:hypothetical protein
MDPTSATLILRCSPADGIKDELSSVAKMTGISETDLAVAVLLSRRGQYDVIGQAEAHKRAAHGAQ